MTTKAQNIQALAKIQERGISFDVTVWICECQGVAPEIMPSECTSGRCAIAYFDDGSQLEFSDANPVGVVSLY